MQPSQNMARQIGREIAPPIFSPPLSLASSQEMFRMEWVIVQRSSVSLVWRWYPVSHCLNKFVPVQNARLLEFGSAKNNTNLMQRKDYQDLIFTKNVFSILRLCLCRCNSR
jgi:hypothetical protein